MFGFKKFATGGIVNPKEKDWTTEGRLKLIEERLDKIEGRNPLGFHNSWLHSFCQPLSLVDIQIRLFNLAEYLKLVWCEETKRSGYQKLKSKPKYPHQDGHRK